MQLHIQRKQGQSLTNPHSRYKMDLRTLISFFFLSQCALQKKSFESAIIKTKKNHTAIKLLCTNEESF